MGLYWNPLVLCFNTSWYFPVRRGESKSFEFQTRSLQSGVFVSYIDDVEKFIRFNQDLQTFELLSINICIRSLFSYSPDRVYPPPFLSIQTSISAIIYFNIHLYSFCYVLKIKNINFPRRFQTLDWLNKFE